MPSNGKSKTSTKQVGGGEASKTLCAICKVRERKYKCPVRACGAAYCSVACFKVHKRSSCTEPVVTSSDAAPAAEASKSVTKGDSGVDARKEGDDVGLSVHASEGPLGDTILIAEQSPHVVDAGQSTTSPPELDSNEPAPPKSSISGPPSPLIPSITPTGPTHRSKAQLDLRTLSSLSYPPEPDPDVFLDPLRVDERERCVERDGWLGVAQSPELRQILATHPSLKPLLTAIQTRMPTPEHRSRAIARILAVDEVTMMTAMSAGERERRWAEEGFYLEGLLEDGWAGQRGGRGGRGAGYGRGSHQVRGRGRGRFQPYSHSDDRVQSDDSSGGTNMGRFWIGRDEKEALKAFAESVRDTLERVERDKNGDAYGARRVEWEL